MLDNDSKEDGLFILIILSAIYLKIQISMNVLTRHRLGYFRTHDHLGGGGSDPTPLLSRELMVVSSPARRRSKALYQFFPKHA